jgi:hypothetical protein
VTCELCKLGWPLHIPISPSQDARHSYPKDYKGMRAGFGGYCTDRRSIWNEDEKRWERQSPGKVREESAGGGR